MEIKREINDGVLVICRLCDVAEKFLELLKQGRQASADIQQQQITQDGIAQFGEMASKLLSLFTQPEKSKGLEIIPMIISMLKKPQQSPDPDPEPQPTAPEETTQPNEDKEKQ